MPASDAPGPAWPRRMAALERAEAALRALDAPLRLLLWEGDDPRAAAAAALLARIPNLRVVALGCAPEATRGTTGALSAAAARLDPQAIAAAWTSAARSERAPRSACELASAALALDLVDAAVGGVATASADVLRAGFQFLGLAAGTRTVSIGGLVEPVAGPLAGHLFLMTDTGAVLEPTLEQFVDIAANAVKTWRAVSAEPPRIAFLSASTHGSAEGLANLETIRAAVRAVRRADPSLAVDGELQLDSAVSPHVAGAKGVGGRVAGRANILVFPDIDSCNIGYKIVEHLGGALTAPVTQGFARSYHDVSRGAAPHDLAATCLFAAMIGAAGAETRRRPGNAQQARPRVSAADERGA